MEDPRSRADRSLVPALVKAFDEAKDGDPRIRRYLALAIGRLEPPLPREAVDVLTKALRRARHAWTPDIVSRLNGWADIDINEARIMHDLGAGFVGRRLRRGEARAVVRVEGCRHPEDGRLRAWRAARARRSCRRCTTALKDEAADVRWNAAVALARHDSAEGVPVLRQMLDRAFVEQTVKRGRAAGRGSGSGGGRDDQRPSRRGRTERADAQGLGRRIEPAGPQPAVRQAALEALKTMG